MCLSLDIDLKEDQFLSMIKIYSFNSFRLPLSHQGSSMITARLSSSFFFLSVSSIHLHVQIFNRNKFNCSTHTLDWRSSNACHPSKQWKWLHQSLDSTVLLDNLPCSFVLHAHLSIHSPKNIFDCNND